ncbi:MAG: hypothetical protein AB7F86_10370 [Bdellovibrionales bacterium]
MIRFLISTVLALSTPVAYVHAGSLGGTDIPVVDDDAEKKKQEEEKKKKEEEAKKNQGNNGTNINNNSHIGQNSQNNGSNANNMAGAMLIATGSALLPNPPTTAQGAMLIAMGIMALMQGAHDKDAANASGLTGYNSALNGTGVNEGSKNGTDPGSGNSGYSEQIKEANKKLAAAGYKVTDQGLVHPDGKITPASAFSSQSALQNAGVDPNVLAELDKINKAVADSLQKFSVSSVGTEGGGGGAATHGYEDQSVQDGTAVAAVDPFALSDAQKKALAEGKTVLMGGEPIGVAGANIFDMVHKCYQKKRTGNQFFEEGGGVGAVATSTNTSTQNQGGGGYQTSSLEAPGPTVNTGTKKRAPASNLRNR